MQIPLDQFELLISETILKRGLSYFKNGYVNEPEEITTGLYEAIVEGTENYTVRLTIENGIIVEYVCNCPYDMGPVCKHIAALIFYLQQDVLGLKMKGSTSPNPKKKTKKRKTIAGQVLELLETISHDELIQFISEQATKNSSFRNLFLSSFAHHNPNESKGLYQKQVKSILRSASGRHGFIDWSAARQVNHSISNLLDSALKHFKNKNYRSAVFICTAIMEQMTKALQHADDSNADIGGSIEYGYEMLHDIAKEDLTEEIRKLILDYCVTAFDKNIYSGWNWHTGMLHISSILLKTDDETERVLAQIDKVQKSEYAKNEAQSIKYGILRRTKGEKQANKYLEQNITNPELRRVAISNAMESEDYDKANSIALDGVSLDKKDKPGLVMEWNDWLLKIAQATNDSDKILEYSRILFIDNYRHEQDYYQILKQNVLPDKWDKFVEEIINDITTKNRWSDPGLIAGIFIKEEWWDRLLEFVRKSPDLYTIEHYEQYLSKGYADELALLYSDAIIDYMENNMGRKHYQNACRYIRRIIKLGNMGKANEIIEILRTEYPKRRVLMEELNSV